MCEIYVVDAPCGAGKTSGAIHMMDSDVNTNEKYLFITPFLKEVARIKDQCKSRKFFEPQEKGTKLNSIHWLIANDKNIVSTHSLFLNFNEYTVELLKQKEYTLVLDEVADVVEIMDISIKDLTSILKDYAHVEDGLLIWDDMEYEGKFSDIMRMSLNRCVGIYGDTALIWCFPIEIFKIFKKVYILTYMFDAQIQKYYYDFYNVKYQYKYIDNSNGLYRFTNKCQKYDFLRTRYKDIINILNNEKLNSIGDNTTALSVAWFKRDNFTYNKPLIKALKNNITNYFKNITKSPSNTNMWTTYKNFKGQLRGGGYSRGFVSVNARATNEHRHRTNLAYCANIFMNPILKQFFMQRDVVVNEGLYALSELVQWVWRSGVRDGNKINIYLPSSRMRNLFIDWLHTN